MSKSILMEISSLVDKAQGQENIQKEKPGRPLSLGLGAGAMHYRSSWLARGSAGIMACLA